MSTVEGIPEHGGQIELVMQMFPDAPSPFIDLSTGISPYPYPFEEVLQADLIRLPEQGEEEKLLNAAMKAYDIQSSKQIVACPGTQLVISVLPYILNNRKAILLGPTYSGHATAWRNAGSDVHIVDDLKRFIEEATQPGCVGILCNPNNPDGLHHDPQDLLVLADRCASVGSYLIVDEAYVDFENHISVASYLPHPALIVLRSFGKTYGLPGVRLGFFLATDSLAERVRKMLGAWAVSTPAIIIGCEALTDRGWLEQQKKQLNHAMHRFLQLCRTVALPVAGYTCLFALVRMDEAHSLWAHLCKRGIVTRIFSERPSDIRFGLPRCEMEWQRLEKALYSWKQEKI